MSDTPESPKPADPPGPPVAAAAPAKEPAAAPGVETFENPQFRHGEFTPFAPPAAEALSAATPDTLPPNRPELPPSVIATAPIPIQVVRPPDVTATVPPPEPPASTPPAAPPAPSAALRPLDLTANAAPPVPPGSVAAPVARAPAPPPVARAPLPPPNAPVASNSLGVIIFVGILAYLLGCLSAWAYFQTQTTSVTPLPPPAPSAPIAEAAPAVAAAPRTTASPPAPPGPPPAPPNEEEHPAEAANAAPHHEHAVASTERHHTTAPAPAPAPAPTPAPAPAAVAPPPPAATSGLLKIYETEILAQAQMAAKKANDTVLAGQIAQLITARQKAEEARRDKDLATEAANVDAAYHIDLAIDRGAGPYHHPLQAEAVRLHLQLGDQHAAHSEPQAASDEYRAALRIQPDSAEAKQRLAHKP